MWRKHAKRKKEKIKKKGRVADLFIFRIILSHLFIDGHVVWKDRAIFSK